MLKVKKTAMSAETPWHPSKIFKEKSVQGLPALEPFEHTGIVADPSAQFKATDYFQDIRSGKAESKSWLFLLLFNTVSAILGSIIKEFLNGQPWT